MIFTGGNGASIMSTNTRRNKGGKMSIVHCEVGQYKRSITAIALDDEDKYAYCGTKSGDGHVWYTRNRKVQTCICSYLEGPHSLSQGAQECSDQIKFTKDNSNIVSASADGSCIVWDFTVTFVSVHFLITPCSDRFCIIPTSRKFLLAEVIARHALGCHGR